MKVKAIAVCLALFLLGGFSSFALAKGKPPKHGGSTGATTTNSTSTSTTTSKHGKVTLCHKAGKSGRWVKITVSQHAVSKHLKRGDVMPDASGKCPASSSSGTTTTTGTTTTSG